MPYFFDTSIQYNKLINLNYSVKLLITNKLDEHLISIVDRKYYTMY